MCIKKSEDRTASPSTKVRKLYLSDFDSVFDMRQEVEMLVEKEYVVFCYGENGDLLNIYKKADD